MSRQFYLELYFDVLEDPLIAKLPQTWQLAFIRLLTQAVKSEEPGVILMTRQALTRAIGWRKVERTEALLTELEDSRLIGFRKGDDAIVLASRLLPQLRKQKTGDPEAEERLPPRRQKPSDDPARVLERVRRSRAAEKEDARPESVGNPETAFFGETEAVERGCNAPCNAPVSPPLAEHPYSIEEESTAAASSRGVTVDENATENAAASDAAAFDTLRALCEEGMDRKVAIDLVAEYGEERVEKQLRYWPFTKMEKSPRNPPGMLRRAIEEDWPAPSGFREHLQKQRTAEIARAQQERAEADRARQRQEREAAAVRQSDFLRGLTPAERDRIEAEAIARMPSPCRHKLEAHNARGETPGALTKAALDDARNAVIAERLAAA